MHPSADGVADRCGSLGDDGAAVEHLAELEGGRQVDGHDRRTEGAEPVDGDGEGSVQLAVERRPPPATGRGRRPVVASASARPGSAIC